MKGWLVSYGRPFPGWRSFTDVGQALDFAETAVSDEQPTITTDPATLRQLLDSTEEPTP